MSDSRPGPPSSTAARPYGMSRFRDGYRRPVAPARRVNPRVPVAPEVLSWAAWRSGRGHGALTHHFPTWDRWLAGQRHPTIRQVRELAQFTSVPFGYFFLPAPPELGLPLPDFRAGRGRRPAEPSLDLLAVIHASQERQSWYREYAVGIGAEALALVGSAGQSTAPEDVAEQITRRLRFDVADRHDMTWRDARRHLLQGFESLGGLAVASSMVGNNTHRILDPDEFRGFTIADPIAPLIFVNAADTLAGQIFTALHEMAHVWRGESGVSDEAPDRPPDDDVERWCNRVAGEVLVPLDDLRRRYRPGPLTPQLDALAAVYCSSTLVVLLQLRRADLVPREGFDRTFAEETARVRGLAHTVPSTGGDFYRTQPYRLGERLPRAVIAETYAGRTTVTEALQLLSFSTPEHIDRYARTLGVA